MHLDDQSYTHFQVPVHVVFHSVPIKQILTALRGKQKKKNALHCAVIYTYFVKAIHRKQCNPRHIQRFNYFLGNCSFARGTASTNTFFNMKI